MHTASLQDCIYNTLIDGQGVLCYFLKKALISTDAEISHFFEGGIGIDEFALGDKVASNLLFASVRD